MFYLFVTDLQLLYPKKHWRIFGNDNDELYRNAVVNDLLYKALKLPDLEVATTLIYTAIEKKFDFSTGFTFQNFIIFHINNTFFSRYLELVQ